MIELSNHIQCVIPSIPENHITRILECVESQTFSKKDHLLLQSEYAKRVYFLSSGCTRTYIHDYNGVEHNISFAMENWWCGDLQSFLNRTSANYNIQALEDTSVLSINQEQWNSLLKEVPEFANYTRILFRNTMFSQDDRIVQNLSLTAEDRYEQFLNKYPKLSQRISQKHMASYLGITPEFLSMIRSKRK